MFAIGLDRSICRQKKWGGPTFTSLGFLLVLLLGAGPGCRTSREPILRAPEKSRTVLGIKGSHFTGDGKPTFLLGISYYAALGAPEEFIRKDLDDIQRYGFNWLRVWLTWGAFGNNISAFDSKGQPKEPSWSKLKWLAAECDRRGLVLDLTFSRRNSADSEGQLPDFAAHRRAVESLVTTLKMHRNWYLDLANEHDVRDARYVPDNELKTLRELVRDLDFQRLVTASFGGHDLTQDELQQAVLTLGFDFICPHRPRHAGSPGETERMTRSSLETMSKAGRVVPIHYQEPFRRGYSAWEPTAADFLEDLRGAVAGGAAGWCFHNGSQQKAPEDQPRRSFDLHSRRLFEQLDAEEQKVVKAVAAVASGNN